MEEWETFVRSLAERYGLQQQQSQSESQEDQEHRWVTSSVKKQHDDDDRYVRDDAGMAPSQDPVLPCVLECSTSSTTEGYNDCQESAAAQGITATFASRTHKILSPGPAAAVSRLERNTSSPVADVSYNRPASPTSVLAAAHTCSSSDSSAATDVPFNRGQSSDCNLLPVANTLLADAGFPPITKPLSGEQLLGTVVDLAREYVRRESFIQELLEEAERSRRQEEQSNLLLVRQDGELQLWKKKLASSEQRSQAALSAAAKAASRFRREVQSLEATNSNLQQRCSQLEHNCRSKERDARKYQTRLLESIEKEESQRSKDVECYRNLKNKVMRARQARGASGGLDWNLLSRDLKPLQLVKSTFSFCGPTLPAC
ncbi:uncharacterized protein LOC112346175 [Selaginella moellendorffii]|uniref:uncharacterized protein LOC112346175 n=1 Tax=Selaginella moellendorffii TaxID=88036 RepID=UPI000D1C4DB1|nr:uncharacterized protein LOC112346175 [Selaginella moellendorffii]|eukprot:XP_024530231.1 uncharacterized protein LOC112346175 [Selaginella moellendorffii]